MAANLRAIDALAAKYARRLRYAINPQVICCETQEEAERLADEAECDAGPRDRMVNALGAGLIGTLQILAERLRRYEEIAMMQRRQSGRSGNGSVSLDRSPQRRILLQR